ncbi:MAG: hypothetical protein HYS25_02090 [Ignavibacteriales bacterium]|nr:hypothetical protein [Ignavibacteriales bacterium]
MKKILIIIFCLITTNLFSQTLSEENKNNLLSRINNNTDDTVIDSLKEFKVVEAIPLLEQYFWQQNQYRKGDFLKLLYELESPNTLALAQTYLDSIKTGETILDKYHYSKDIFSAMDAFEVSFLMNDFSRVEFYFEFLARMTLPGDSHIYISPMLILCNRENFKERARPYFEAIIKDGSDIWMKGIYVEKYHEIYRDESLALAKYVAANDTSSNVRYSVLRKVITKYKYEHLLPFYRERLERENSELARIVIAWSILNTFPSPNNYIYVKQSVDNFGDEAKTTMRYGGFYKYVPMLPDSGNTIGVIIDSLRSYQNQCEALYWIGDTTFVIQLDNLLDKVRERFLMNDSVGTAVEIKNYQELINEEYLDTLDNDGKYVTADAYKFLFYYPQYILERLPAVTEPRNDLTAKASAEVTTVNGVLQYSYTITNEAVSSQSAANIYVEDTTTSTTSAPVNWRTEKVQNKLDRFYTAANPITAGTAQSGYKVTSNSLPVIGKVYVQSERFAVDTTDIKTNSYEVTTVVPSERPSQINASAFIDSMISYNNRAYALNWMQYYWVRDNNYYQLNNAKTMINMNVPASAVVILTAFEGWLDTCMSQSYFNKETYGLLKYNSIYLREKLSGQ